MLIILNEDEIILKEPKKDNSKSFSYSYQSSSIIKDGKSFKKVKEVSDTPEATIIKSKAFKNGKEIKEAENINPLATAELNMLKASGMPEKNAKQKVFNRPNILTPSQQPAPSVKPQPNIAGQNVANSNIGQGIANVANKVTTGIGNVFKKFNG